MIVPIHIPIGARHVAAIRGAVWKLVDCEYCEERYAYLLELEATGQDHDLLFLDGAGSAARALVQAEQNLLKKSQNVVLPVPCPNCGSYQNDMAQLLKDNASINSLQIVGGVITLLSFVPLAFDISGIWVLTVVLALVGLTMMVRGVARAIRYDANAGDPEPRKVVGRQCSVWREQLAELLATAPPTAVVEPTPRVTPAGD